jgi:hypothetical protein
MHVNDPSMFIERVAPAIAVFDAFVVAMRENFPECAPYTGFSVSLLCCYLFERSTSDFKIIEENNNLPMVYAFQLVSYYLSYSVTSGHFGGKSLQNDIPMLTMDEFIASHACHSNFENYHSMHIGTIKEKIRIVEKRRVISMPNEHNMCGFYALLEMCYLDQRYDEEGDEIYLSAAVSGAKSAYMMDPSYSENGI